MDSRCSVEEDFFEMIPDEEPVPEAVYVERQDVEAIRNCIGKLSDEQRTVIMAYYYDDLKIDEIAEVFSVSSGTIKSRLFHARKKLKEVMMRKNLL